MIALTKTRKTVQPKIPWPPKITSKVSQEAVRTPAKVMAYLQKVRVFDKAVPARWHTVAFENLTKAFAKDVHKEFMRQYRASMKFLNDQDAFNKIHAYAQEAHPGLYEKSMPITIDEEIEAIIKMSMGSLEDIVIDKTKAEDMAIIDRFFEGWADNVSPERMEEVMGAYLPKAANLGGNRALQDLGIKIAFNLKNPEIMQEIMNRGVKITGGISQTTLNNFRNTFYRGYMQKGMSPYDLKKQIKGMFEETYKNRAMTIARTETGVAQMTVQHQTYLRNGVTDKKWLSTVDERTRPSHVAADGQERKIDKPFDVGGVAMMHPLDGYAPAREVINCRCDYTEWQTKEENKPEIPWTGGED